MGHSDWTSHSVSFRVSEPEKVRLIRADSPEEAFEKAEALGRDSERRDLNTEDKTVTFRYRGLRDLFVIYDELEDGCELMFEEKTDVAEEDLRSMITSKSDLSVFEERQPPDPSRPNYGPKEIMEMVNRLMRSDDMPC